MTILLNKIKDFLKHNHIILLGFIIIVVYVWNRFFRNRIPKELPYEYLSVLGFFILLYICLIFTYILYSLIFSKGGNKLIEIFIDWVFTPIKELEKFIRTLPVIKTYYLSAIEFMMPFLEFSIIKTKLFFILFWLLPRVILLSALIYDVFILKQFHYKYQVILWGLLLFFNRCFKYSLKNILEEEIKNLKSNIETIHTKYVRGVHPLEFEDDDEEDNDIPPTMPLPTDIFIKFQVESIVYKNITREILVWHSTKNLDDNLWKTYAGHPWVFYRRCDDVPSNYVNNFGTVPPRNYNKAWDFILIKEKEYFYEEYNNILKLALVIEHMTKTSNHNLTIKYIKIVIYMMYLICWLYVLIISLPNLDIEALLQALENIIKQLTDPFSDTYEK
jgi:hypothetical protein